MTTKGFVPNRVKAQIAPPPSSVKLFRVTAVYQDFLLGVSYSIDANNVETVGTDGTFIRKPYDLQRTPFDGVTFQGRTFTYYSNSLRYDHRKVVITSAPITVEADGVAPVDATTLALINEYWPSTTTPATVYEKVWPEYVQNKTVVACAKAGGEWHDLNADGRRWEMPWRAVTVCIDNDDGTTTSRRVMIRTSDPFV